MPEKTMYEELIADDEMARMVAQEKLILSVTESICEVLNDNNVTRSELAKRLGKTKGYVSQVLGGSRNITLRTLADIVHCLGYRASITIDTKKEKRIRAQFVETWDPTLNEAEIVRFNQSPDEYFDHEPLDVKEMAG